MTFGEVVDLLQKDKEGQELNKVTPTNGQSDFIQNNPELWQKARETNYEIFSRIYVDKDQLLDDKKQDEDEERERGSKRDDLIKHLFRLQEIIWLYTNGQFNEFLKITDFKDSLVSVEKKRELKEKIENLIDVENKKIGEIIDEAHEHGILIKGDEIDRFIERKKYVFDQVKKVPFKVFQDLFEFLEGRTPFTTQHKTKGTEFDNIFIILDNGGWSSYNFKYLFEGNGTASVIERTNKLFYVCCTRAMECLAVYYHDPSDAVIDKAKEWFGVENVINLDYL
jgi:DNA helicase-2/ATP-dependent DNA helicase PcrA